MYQMAAELMTGAKTETYSNKHMEEGLEREEETINAFNFITGIKTRPVSLIKPGTNARYHCSPDSIVVDKEEGLEVKSVIPATQVKYLDQNKLPTEYSLQCQFSLFVTGWKVWHFFSYHPDLPPLIIKVERNEDLISKIKTAVWLFNREVDDLIERLKA